MSNDSRAGGDGVWTRIWARPKTRWLLGIPLGGFVALILGAIGLGVFNEVLHATSSNEFCYVCHSHEQFIKPEYEASSHFANTSGVRADCADCHLPHGQIELILTKIVVSADIVPELLGRLDTAEKYEAARVAMAEVVWEQYRANDSEYCRHCHTIEAMDLAAQGNTARRRHGSAAERDQTCIDCHKGIVHVLPQDVSPDSD
jgi:trimethylamine-N-oxide reductase cytochrome c-type subunit TorC